MWARRRRGLLRSKLLIHRRRRQERMRLQLGGGADARGSSRVVGVGGRGCDGGAGASGGTKSTSGT